MGAHHDPAKTLAKLDALIGAVRDEAQQRLAAWPPAGPAFEPSARNLAAWLALRRHDLRPLQQSLMALGLSSLGRLESRVLEALDAVRASLAAIAGEAGHARPTAHRFFAGERRLQARAAALFGPAQAGRPVAVLVTCPGESAGDPAFFMDLAQRGVEAIRINCAHDDATAWGRMIDHAHAASSSTGHRLRIFMDLAGPKIRTGKVRLERGHRLRRGDTLAVARPGALRQAHRDVGPPAAECTLRAVVQAAQPGHRLFYDDGKFGATVLDVHDWGLLARIDTCEDKSVKLKPEKGLNFPDTAFHVDALTDKDLADLDFVALHADAVEYSFVQCAGDVVLLQQALAARRDDWRDMALVLKIETAHAIERLPDIVVQAASQQPAAVMIARGDLAVEIGFGRTAEMQEEMLWLAEAAQVPAIWATQVLEHLVAKDTPSRGEMTDAAMAARAECVMLNKGPFVADGIAALETLLVRMAAHQHKKTPELRPLRSWPRP